MILLPDVGYLAETPLAMSGSLINAFNSAFRASGLTVLPGRVLRSRWYGRSGSSGSDNLQFCQHSQEAWHTGGPGTDMDGSISRSMASAASLSQLRS